MALRSWLAQSCALAVAYYVTGRLALLLAIPPGYATAVWPAAGVALAGLLVFGNRAWPGILVASFCINFPTAAGGTGSMAPPIGLALVLGAGASLQALVGASLVRRSCGYPALTASDARIGKLLLLGGPVACVVSATIGIAALGVAHAIRWPDAAHSWLTWWVGDTIGVLAVMPLFLAWTASATQLSPRGKLLVSIPVLLLFAAAIQVFHQASTWSVLSAGLLFIGFASALLLMLASRRVAVESEVRARTAELDASHRALLREEQRMIQIRDNTFDAYIVIDADSRILEWNSQAERLFGWSLAEVRGHRLTDTVIPPLHRQAHLEGVQRHLAGMGQSARRRFETTAMHRDGRRFPVELKIWSRIAENGRPELHAFIHDIGARQRENRRLAAQTTAAAALIEADVLAEAAPRLLQAVCSALDWSVGLLWLIDPSDGSLHCAQVWHPSAETYPHFVARSRETRFAPGTGLPGRVLDSGKAEWVADVALDDNFPRAGGAVADGLHGAFAVPVLKGSQPLGAIEFFSSTIEEPDPELLGMMDTLGNLLGQFIARTQAETALEQEREFLDAVLDNITEGIVACDASGNLTVFNRATRELQGLPEDPLPPEQWAEHYDLFQPDGVTRMVMEEVPLYRAFNGEDVHDMEIVIAPSGRSRRVVVCNGRALISRAGEKLGAVVAMHDITERKGAEQRLQQLAHFDPLTGLPNRRLFHDSLRAGIAAADAQQWTVFLLFLDLDNFKGINDSLGHAVGDELLRQVGQRLLGCLRTRDTVGRLGGDEFGVILLTRDSDPQIAVKVANKIHEALSAPFELDGHAIGVTASLGITAYPSDTADVHSLVRYADLAMYAAKQGGRNGHRFYTEMMNVQAREKLELEAALRGALAREEFVLHYQPKVCLRTGRWTGVEALLRWQRPGMGLVPPADFIPMLEDTGMISAVGGWVIAAACRQHRAWQETGIGPLPIAVNVSAQQVARRGLRAAQSGDVASDKAHEPAELWIAANDSLRMHGIAAEQLEFELTESIVMSDAEHSQDVLQRLKLLGIRVSLDDFGTGYSSLAYLRRFPLDAVKIDRSFIDDVGSKPDGASIALAIIGLAHQLNLKVIAEGVETVQQLQFLRANGCDQAQGYYIARPMSAQALERLWRESGGVMRELAQ